jgi:hypothetical protein
MVSHPSANRSVEQRAECWWLWLAGIGITSEQLGSLREDIRSHGLTPTSFYELLETRGAPAVLTFLGEFRRSIPPHSTANEQMCEPRLFDIG